MISFSLFDRVKFIILLLPERWRTLSSSLLFDTNTIQRSCSRYIYTHNHLPDLFTHLTIDESFSCGRCGVVIKLILLLLLPLLRVSTVLSIYLPIMPSSRVFLFLIFFLCTVVSCRPSPHDYMPLCLRFMPSANDSSFFLLDAMCYIYNIDPFLPHSTCPNRRNTKETIVAQETPWMNRTTINTKTLLCAFMSCRRGLLASLK